MYVMKKNMKERNCERFEYAFTQNIYNCWHPGTIRFNPYCKVMIANGQYKQKSIVNDE